MKRHILASLLLVACTPGMGSAPGAADRVVAVTTSTCTSVADYGAIPNDGVDDTPAIQDAIDACAAFGGGEVTVPVGVYTLQRHGGWEYFAIAMADGVRLRGEGRFGTVLRMAPSMAGSVKLINTNNATDAAISDMTLEGDAAAQTPNEHRHGIVVDGAARLLVERVNVQNFTGDGIYVYNGVTDLMVRDSKISGNKRNGLTIGATAAGVQVDGLSVSGCQIVGNSAQQLDSEPGLTARISDVRVTDTLLDAQGASNDFVMTISGTGTPYKGSGWSVTGSRINGSLYVVWFDDVTVSGNTFNNPTTKAAVYVYRSSSRVTVTGNVINMTNATASSNSAVRLQATGVGNQPDDVVVADNVMTLAYAANMGVDVYGVRRAVISGNTIVGAGSVPYYAGVRVRGAVQVESVIVTGNNIRNFVKGFDVADPAGVRTTVVTGNTFNDMPLVWP